MLILATVLFATYGLLRTRIRAKGLDKVVVSTGGRRALIKTGVCMRSLGGKASASGGNRFSVRIPTKRCQVIVSCVKCHAQRRRIEVSRLGAGGLIVHLRPRARSLNRIIIATGDRTHRLHRRTVPVSIVDVRRLRKAIDGIRSILSGAMNMAVHGAKKMNDSSHISMHNLRKGHVNFFVSNDPVGSGSSFVSVGSVPMSVVSQVRVCGKIMPTEFNNSSIKKTMGVIVERCPPGCLSTDCDVRDFGARGLSLMAGHGVTAGKLRFKNKKFCACSSGGCGVRSPFRRKLVVGHGRSGFGGLTITNDLGTHG